jgi:hypothetical protein
MGLDDQNAVKDHQSTNELFYSKVVKHDSFLHIVRFIHFKNNVNLADGTSSDCDRLWKLRRVFGFHTVPPYRKFGRR